MAVRKCPADGPARQAVQCEDVAPICRDSELNFTSIQSGQTKRSQTNSKQRTVSAQTRPTPGQQAISDKRRSALQYLLATAAVGVPATIALPSRWRQPVINTVLLPAHAQTTCTATPPSTDRFFKDHDECLVVTLSGALQDATAELRTPSGTVIPALSLATLTIGGCCNATGHTVQATSVVVNLAAPASPVTLPTGSATVTSSGNFSIDVATPVSPVLVVTDITDVTVDLTCDNEVSITVVIAGSQISSATSGTAPAAIVCQI